MRREWLKTLPAFVLAAVVFIGFRYFGRDTEPAPQPEETVATTQLQEETTEEPTTEATTEAAVTETTAEQEDPAGEETDTGALPVRQGLLPQESVRLQTEDGAEWILAAYEPTGSHPDVQLRLLKDGAVAQVLEDPGPSEAVDRAAFSSVRRVQYKDLNGDGIPDLHILCEYLGTGTDNRDQILLQERIYSGGKDGAFTLEKDPSEDIVYNSWKEAYTAYVNSPFAEDYDSFSLISLNEDNLPEFVAADTKGSGGMSVLFFREGRWVEKCFARTDLYYIEKENLLLESSGILDRYYDILYSISGGRFVITAEGSYGLPEDTVDVSDAAAEEAAAEQKEDTGAEEKDSGQEPAEKEAAAPEGEAGSAPDTSRYVYVWGGAEVTEKGYRDGRAFLFPMDRAVSCLDGMKDRERILKDLAE